MLGILVGVSVGKKIGRNEYMAGGIGGGGVEGELRGLVGGGNREFVGLGVVGVV